MRGLGSRHDHRRRPVRPARARPCSARSPRPGSAPTGPHTPRASRRTATDGVPDSQSAPEGKAAFDAYLGKPFPIEQAGTDGEVAGERSPYGIDLGVTYPHVDVDALLARGAGARCRPGATPVPTPAPASRWRSCARINARSHELAQAVMHTTGQAYAMAFQAGGPHAQDRALEAIAYALRGDDPASAPRPSGRSRRASGRPQRMTKRFTVVPRGVALVIGCNTFPTWNSYPGLFASLVTGNAVVVKPHPRGGAAAGHHRADRPRGAGRGRLLPRPRHARAPSSRARGWPRCWPCAPEVRVIDYTGSSGVRRLAGAQRPPGGRCSPRRPASTRSCSTPPTTTRACSPTSRSRCRSTAARCARPRRTCCCPRDGITADGEPQVGRRGRAGPRRRRRRAARRRRAGRRAARRDRQRGRARRGSTRRRRTATSSSPRARSTHPDFPDATVRTPAVVRLDGRTATLPAGVLRPGRVPDHDRRAPTQSIGRAARRVREHGRASRRPSTPPTRRCSSRRGGRARRRRRAVVQPHRDGVRQPVGRVLRLPRHRRQPGRQRGAHRRRLRRQPVPHRAVAPAPPGGDTAASRRTPRPPAYPDRRRVFGDRTSWGKSD